MVFTGAAMRSATVMCVAWDMLQVWCKAGIVIGSMLLGD
jgi:hypothetical protein